MLTISETYAMKAPLGTFGDLVHAIGGLFDSNGLVLAANLALMLAFAVAGYKIGRRVSESSLPLAAAAAVFILAASATGATAGYFVVNAGIFCLAFCYPVWEEAYLRVSG